MLVDFTELFLRECKLSSPLKLLSCTHLQFVTLVVLEYISQRLHSLHINIIKLTDKSKCCLKISFKLKHLFLGIELNTSHLGCKFHVLNCELV